MNLAYSDHETVAYFECAERDDERPARSDESARGESACRCKPGHCVCSFPSRPACP